MKRFEFSKLIMCLVMGTYFVGIVVGVCVIFELLEQGTTYYSSIATALCGLFSYIGAPVAVTIGFYSNKAKAENVEKIKISGECLPPETGTFTRNDGAGYAD